MSMPKVGFSLINCNRKFYLESCAKSLLECTRDYENKELLIIDNASVEEGTDELLIELSDIGFTVLKQVTRDPNNEFARALNASVDFLLSKRCDYIAPLQGDMQFVLRNKWLQEYVSFFEEHKQGIGCILFDAQRDKTNKSHSYSQVFNSDKFPFVFDATRNPINCAADVMYSKEILELMGKWSENNLAHEGGKDSETAMLEKVNDILTKHRIRIYCALPVIPVSCGIFTDMRGTNARVRGNKRYGDYWPAKESYYYYKINELEKFKQYFDNSVPVGIENIAEPIGWPRLVDEQGQWLKNPIRPETASESDYVILSPEEKVQIADDNYIDEWLNA